MPQTGALWRRSTIDEFHRRLLDPSSFLAWWSSLSEKDCRCFRLRHKPINERRIGIARFELQLKMIRMRLYHRRETFDGTFFQDLVVIDNHPLDAVRSE